MPFLTIDGIELFYEATGSGAPAIVLVHGGMCDHRDWDRLVPALAARHAVVAVDLRAHGRSAGDPTGFSIARCADDLNALIDALGLAPVVLVGHSFAARIVVEAALARSDNAAGVVLLDGSRTAGGRAATRGAERPMAAPLATVLATTIGPAIEGAERARLLDTMSSTSPELMAACVAEIERWDRSRADIAFAALPQRLRVLAIQSTYHDQATPRRSLTAADVGTPYLDFLRDAVADIDVRILPDTGHFSMIERTQEVAALLIAFAAAVDHGEPMERMAT